MYSTPSLSTALSCLNDGVVDIIDPCMGWGSWIQGGVLLGDSQLHLHQEDSVGGGGGSGLFLIVTSIYKLCQLSALSASILRLPEQTKTGATRGRGC